MYAKRVFGLVAAVILTIAAVMVLFPGWVRDIAPGIQIPLPFSLEGMDIAGFPFYGDALRFGEGTNFGVSNIVAAYADYVETGTGDTPNFLNLLGRLNENGDFLEKLYTFLLTSLLTIPVYMLLRLVVYNALYDMAEDYSFLGRAFARGAVAVDASLVTVTATWVLQKRYLALIVDYIKDKIARLTTVQFALNATNLVILGIIAFAVIALLRATLFRGSVFTSILGAILRTLLFIVLIAVISVFIGRTTLRTVLFMLAAVFVIGIVKEAFIPEARPRRARKR